MGSLVVMFTNDVLALAAVRTGLPICGEIACPCLLYLSPAYRLPVVCLSPDRADRRKQSRLSQLRGSVGSLC